MTSSTITADTQVTILGAGPYGLAIAAHLRDRGIHPQVFGHPMESWKRNMPEGMFLRSGWDACHISDPRREFTLNAFESKIQQPIGRPVPLADFIEYGHWFQRQVLPTVDPRAIAMIRPASSGLDLKLEDGDTLRTGRVVVAAGIGPFARRPAPFGTLPAPQVTHSMEHRSFAPFAGRRVLVVGGGQSALESAVLLVEAGAFAHVIVRDDQVHWLHGPGFRRKFGPLEPLAYPPTDVGPPLLNQIVARPDLFKALPESLQERVATRSIRPAGAEWLRDRLAHVRISTGAVPVAAETDGASVRVRTSRGMTCTADHVLLATGYQVDVRRYPFLGDDLLRELRLTGAFPLLDRGFESSVRGVHFVGAPAAASFGPLMRFVAGSRYAAHALTAAVAGDTARPPRRGLARRLRKF
jgi:FAD-dependent urate hydroxylase